MSFLRSQVQTFYRDLGTVHQSNTGIDSLNAKPNVHRLAEHLNHSIPTFGHISLFSEMALEPAG